MNCDLHTHTNASDGALSPNELLELAAENLVDLLAITDHDTLQAYADLDTQQSKSVTIVAGIELSTAWSGRGIHVVGLNIDPENEILQRGVELQQQARQARAREIANRLTRLGIDNPYDAVRVLAGNAGIGRPHFAQHLVTTGVVRDRRTAFTKYLGAGKLGDVKQCWATLDDVISWIRAAGGDAVLAHPNKYKLTSTKLRLLLAEFVDIGGTAIEVVCGRQHESVTRQLADLARDFGLAASCGSDFHDPGNVWSRPGGFPPLPASLRMVWESW